MPGLGASPRRGALTPPPATPAGKLVLKIPWKNLYTAPVVVLVESLHLLAVPSQGVTYNREKEDAAARDLRKQQLGRYERQQQLADSEYTQHQGTGRGGGGGRGLGLVETG